MGLYRVLKNLTTSNGMIKLGGVEDLKWSADKLEALEQAGAISKVHTPPLSEIPQWEERAEMLPAEIFTVEDFLLANNTKLANVLKLEEAEIPPLKSALWGWVSVTGEPPCGCK